MPTILEGDEFDSAKANIEVATGCKGGIGIA